MDTTPIEKRQTRRRRKNNQLPILIIEDNADQWLVIRSALSQRFPEVNPVWVNNKTQAITYLQACSKDMNLFPRLILVDLYLPRAEDGFGFLEFAKEHTFPKKPTIIVLSSSTADKDIDKVYELGGVSYIVKPNTHSEWLSCFNSLRRYWWELVTLPLYRQQYGS